MTIYERLADIERTGVSAALATVIRTEGSVPRREGTKMIVLFDGRIEGTIGGGEMESQVIKEALLSLSEGQPRRLTYAFRDPEEGDLGVCGGEMEIYIEPLIMVPSLIIFGSGHVGRALAYLGKWLGYRIVAADDRADYAVPELIPEAQEYIHCELADLPDRVKITPDSYIVLTTRGVDIDVSGLPSLLETDAAYIGVIGSRRRWETTAAKLRENGVDKGKIERVVSPMGLELCAETPEEIALSIMAQVVLDRRGGTGEKMAHAPKL